MKRLGPRGHGVAASRSVEAFPWMLARLVELEESFNRFHKRTASTPSRCRSTDEDGAHETYDWEEKRRGGDKADNPHHKPHPQPSP